MKVICTSSEGFEDQLTEGKDYLVLCASPSSYQVLNDNQEAVWYGNNKFFFN